MQTFKVHVTKDYLKFNAAHFIAFPGFREALHGHNYRVSVEVEGDLGPQGYVLDFGIVKRAARRLCDRLDERFIVPSQSDCMTIVTNDDQVVLTYEGKEFRFPVDDCIFLPIVHSSAEELARYLIAELRRELAAEGVSDVRSIEIGVEETPGQAAYCRDES